MPDFKTGKLWMTAITASDYETVKHLLESNQVKASDSFRGWTMATVAAEFNRMRILKDLLVPRLKLKQLGVSGWSGPAHQAAHHSHLEMLKFLAELGVDLSEEKAGGCAPIDVSRGECKKFLKNWLKEKKKNQPNSKKRVVTTKRVTSKQKRTKTTAATKKKVKKEKVTKKATKKTGTMQ